MQSMHGTKTGAMKRTTKETKEHPRTAVGAPAAKQAEYSGGAYAAK